MALEDVYVVHTRPLLERRIELEKALSQHAGAVHWILDPDPADVTPEQWARVRGKRRMRREEVSVYLKHCEVLRRIARASRPFALVLEDDALLPDGFFSAPAEVRAPLPPDADLVFLGASCGLEAPGDPPGAPFARASSTRSMSGVFVRREAAAVVSAALNERPIERPIDHAMNDLISAQNLVVYWSVPALIGNGSESGRFAHSLGVRWRRGGWRSRFRMGR